MIISIPILIGHDTLPVSWHSARPKTTNAHGIANDYNFDNWDAYAQNEVRHYCLNPVTRYDGKIKYLSTIAVMQTDRDEIIPRAYTGANTGRWYANSLYVWRIDLLPEVFDFDAEMKKCRHFATLG